MSGTLKDKKKKYKRDFLKHKRRNLKLQKKKVFKDMPYAVVGN